ncbi:hypothetical protein RHGRI_026754 [Rhododendron griersonianum]|uniref:Uncharacterized protein n=1 Tax=Rhododendron griersonianum TaxID=479676 RepID=A0AAV6IY91_9ERIC|nr:hypothetical protein RHGRI_026754 [Rhododendron griersonianum]
MDDYHTRLGVKKVRFARNLKTGENVAIKIFDKEKILKHKMIGQEETLFSMTVCRDVDGNYYKKLREKFLTNYERVKPHSSKESSVRCPQYVELKLPREGAAFWSLRPYHISRRRAIPAHTDQPDWAMDFISLVFRTMDGLIQRSGTLSQERKVNFTNLFGLLGLEQEQNDLIHVWGLDLTRRICAEGMKRFLFYNSLEIIWEGKENMTREYDKLMLQRPQEKIGVADAQSIERKVLPSYEIR